MDTQQSYNIWAQQYDTNNNKTRDLEATALRHTLSAIAFDNCLEIGCGTGKNTVWLTERAKTVTLGGCQNQSRARESLSNGLPLLQEQCAGVAWRLH